MRRWQEGTEARSFVDSPDGYRHEMERDPQLAPLIVERERRFADRPVGARLTVDFHREALRAVGFADVGEVWRYQNDALLLAIR